MSDLVKTCEFLPVLPKASAGLQTNTTLHCPLYILVIQGIVEFNIIQILHRFQTDKRCMTPNLGRF